MLRVDFPPLGAGGQGRSEGRDKALRADAFQIAGLTGRLPQGERIGPFGLAWTDTAFDRLIDADPMPGRAENGGDATSDVGLADTSPGSRDE